jgi:hypothetical protein
VGVCRLEIDRPLHFSGKGYLTKVVFNHIVFMGIVSVFTVFILLSYAVSKWQWYAFNIGGSSAFPVFVALFIFNNGTLQLEGYKSNMMFSKSALTQSFTVFSHRSVYGSVPHHWDSSFAIRLYDTFSSTPSNQHQTKYRRISLYYRYFVNKF